MARARSTVETTKAAGDRTLDRVIKLVEEAQTQKAPTQVFTDRFERVFVPIVLVADVLVMTVPALLGWWDWSTGFYRAMAMLVASSPCALALGTPATVLAGIAQAARRGVLIKGGMYLETLGTVKASPSTRRARSPSDSRRSLIWSGDRCARR